MCRRFCLVVGCLLLVGSSAKAQTAPTIDPTKVKFVSSCGDVPFEGFLRRVYGVTAKDVDLADEATAGRLVGMAVAFAQEKCPRPYPFGHLQVYILPGDPATFAAAPPPTEPTQLTGGIGAYSGKTAQDEQSLNWVWFHNRSKEKRDADIAVAAAAKQRETERAQQNEEQADIQTRSAAFVAAHGVKHFVTVKQLAANPFVYQGQVVAVYAVFEQMNSATEGLFSASEFSDALLVSAIPPGRFTQARSMVMLAGRVVGKQEIKLPVLGPTLVPHLSFVGSAFCQKQNCADYSILTDGANGNDVHWTNAPLNPARDEVRQAVVDYVSKRFASMNVEVTSVQFSGNQALATVLVYPKGGNAEQGLTVQYQLEKSDDRWVPLGRKDPGAAR